MPSVLHQVLVDMFRHRGELAPELLRTCAGLPELAVLSAMAHPELAVAAAAVGALATLPEDQNRLYLDIILARLPDLIRRLMEARMQGYEYQSEFARKYYGEGLQDAVLAFARAKLETVTAEDEAAIRALHDPRALRELIGALGQAPGEREARAALAAVRPETR